VTERPSDHDDEYRVRRNEVRQTAVAAPDRLRTILRHGVEG
jgi:hypothetical protein